MLGLPKGVEIDSQLASKVMMAAGMFTAELTRIYDRTLSVPEEREMIKEASSEVLDMLSAQQAALGLWKTMEIMYESDLHEEITPDRPAALLTRYGSYVLGVYNERDKEWYDLEGGLIEPTHWLCVLPRGVDENGFNRFTGEK